MFCAGKIIESYFSEVIVDFTVDKVGRGYSVGSEVSSRWLLGSQVGAVYTEGEEAEFYLDHFFLANMCLICSATNFNPEAVLMVFADRKSLSTSFYFMNGSSRPLENLKMKETTGGHVR